MYDRTSTGQARVAAASRHDQQERAKEAKDPEIQAMSDPVMRSVLADLSDPEKTQHHMANAGGTARLKVGATNHWYGKRS